MVDGARRSGEADDNAERMTGGNRMAALDGLRASIGAWAGTSRLYLPGEPIRESQSTASVALAIKGNFSAIAYTWAFDGEPQEGQLLLGYESETNAVNAIFVDSWHMGDKLMICQGRVETNGAVVVRGSYAVEAGPDWGWRIAIEPAGETLRVAMYNVTPDGDELLGYETLYARVA
jgi:hypothetical protein